MAERTPGYVAADFQRKKRRGLLIARSIAINAFLIFHIVAIPFWCLPISSALVLECREFVRPYFLWTGLFQSWDTFSPNPVSTNNYLEALIIYRDGSTGYWTFPRMQLLGPRERYYRERYRKFEENLLEAEHSGLWPDAARYVARFHSGDSVPPATVMLLVRWSNIIQRDDGTFERTAWDTHVFFSYTVTAEDLK
jgi:hypothetical protein